MIDVATKTSVGFERLQRSTRPVVLVIGAVLLAFGFLTVWNPFHLVVLTARGGVDSFWLLLCVTVGITLLGAGTAVSRSADPFWQRLGGGFLLAFGVVLTFGVLFLVAIATPSSARDDGVEVWAEDNVVVRQFEGSTKPILGRTCVRFEVWTGSGLLKQYGRVSGCHLSDRVQEVAAVGEQLVVRFADLSCSYQVDSTRRQLVATTDSCRQRYGI